MKYNTIATTTIQGELHILPTDVMPTCPVFTGKTGPTRRSNPEEAAVQSNLLRKVTTTTLSILILSKAYPTLGILSPLPRHAKLSGSGVLLLKGY